MGAVRNFSCAAGLEESIMQKNQIVRIKYCDYPVLCSECVRFSVSGMKIISGTAHRELAERIAQSVGIQLTDCLLYTSDAADE
mgnify:CR=1 FL=1